MTFDRRVTLLRPIDFGAATGFLVDAARAPRPPAGILMLSTAGELTSGLSSAPVLLPDLVLTIVIFQFYSTTRTRAAFERSVARRSMQPLPGCC